LCVLIVDDLGHTRFFSTTQSYIPHLHGTNINDGWRVTYVDWHSKRKDHPLSSISLEPGYIGIFRQLEMWWCHLSKYLWGFLTWKCRLGHQVYNIFDIMWSIDSVVHINLSQLITTPRCCSDLLDLQALPFWLDSIHGG